MSTSAPKDGGFLAPLLGLVLLAVSIPLTWFTVFDAVVTSPNIFGAFGDSAGNDAFSDLGAMMSSVSTTISVTALNGTIDLFVELPIWVVVLLGGLGALLALVRSTGRWSVPPVLPLLFLVFGLAHIGMALYVIGNSDNGELGFGPFLAAFALLLALPAAVRRRPSAATAAH